MKKEILFVLPGFNFGGTVFSTLNMISFLKNDYNISVLPMTYQGPVIKEYKEANINLLPESVALSAMAGRISKERKITKKILFTYYKLIRRISRHLGINYELFIYQKEVNKIEQKYKFDCAISCQEVASTYFVSFFKTAKKIAWFRSEYSIYKTENNAGILNLDQQLYPKFDKIICVSQTTRNDFASYFPSLAYKVVAIHNIQNVAKIENKANEVVEDIPESDFIIVSVGRINPQKRFSHIPSIARKLLDAGCKFKWLIIGDGNAFGEWYKLQEEIRSNQVDNIVVCLGGRLNPYPYIKYADLLVNTSYVEACPRVVIEAKILKTPVICADFSSAKEFVKPEIDGFVESIDKIHIPICNMIKDKSLYKKIVDNCEAYTIDNEYIYNQLKQLFDE